MKLLNIEYFFYRKILTDGVHARDNIDNMSPETLSEAVKVLKGTYCVRAIRAHKMDRFV